MINAIDPGWVTTDMGGSGRRLVVEGARRIMWATLPDNDPSGGFFFDGKPVP